MGVLYGQILCVNIKFSGILSVRFPLGSWGIGLLWCYCCAVVVFKAVAVASQVTSTSQESVNHTDYGPNASRR